MLLLLLVVIDYDVPVIEMVLLKFFIKNNSDVSPFIQSYVSNL